MRKIYIIGAAVFLFSACKPTININKNATAGNADFTNYLAIGNSLTSGYTDGSLTVSGQLNSYPAMLFQQFSLIPVHGAVGPFVQPLVSGDWGYPGPKYILGTTYNSCIPNDSSLSPIFNTGASDSAAGDYHYVSTVNNGQINNIGVPGIRAVDYRVAGYAAFNTYAKRFYNNLAGSPLDELYFMVHNLHPTFFTMWLGANDVLGYALNGGQGIGDGSTQMIPGIPNLYNSVDISPITAFDTSYDEALNAAISTGASGALINIPDITSIPFFTTVPINGLTLTRQGQADTLAAYYAAQGVKAVFQVGANLFMIKDHLGNVRQAAPGELLLLTTPQDSITCRGWGSTVPISDSLVLTTDEIQFIRNATAAYNAFILQETQLHHLAYVDMNSYFKTLPAGITFDGIKYSTQFVSGGAFSLDGIHPTQRGYALISNYIIGAVNQFYHSNITSIDVNQYKGVTFP